LFKMRAVVTYVMIANHPWTSSRLPPADHIGAG
jgi:hypothetical protein